MLFNKDIEAQRRWRMPLIPTLGRQRQADPCEFEDSLVYRSSPGQVPKQHRETLSQKTKKQTNKKDGEFESSISYTHSEVLSQRQINK